VHTH
jgi:hypothetical protein